MPQTGVPGVRAATADALRDLARQRRRRQDPPPAQARGDADQPVHAGRWTPDHLGLPREDPCPVIPLGVEGDTYYLIDSTGQFRAMKAADFSHSGIQSLFAASPHYVEWMAPRYGRAKGEDAAPPIKSFEDDVVRKLIFRACTLRGLFSPRNRIRGRGAWKLKGGQIVYHAGEDLWLFEGGRVKLLETGLHQDMLYPRAPAVPAPWPEPVHSKDNPARELFTQLRSWTWERPQVDPALMLGCIGVMLIGGALDWRPAVCLVGDRETGKSTLQGVIKAILGTALLESANASAASIYQTMGHDALAVAIDELEAGADNRKQMALVELMRGSASGAIGRRGGADGQSTEFQMRSSFLFSAINLPPLKPQDLSRVVTLRLKPRDVARSGDQKPVAFEDAGRMLLTRLLSEWGRWQETYAAYREALKAGGHSGRGQDTYGTLLAAADLILGPELAEELGLPMVDDHRLWSEWLAAAALPEVDDALPNAQSCIVHLMTSRVPVWRDGARATVGQLLDDLDKFDIETAYAKKQLAQAGLGLLLPGKPFAGYGLAIPNQSQLVAELFAGTDWQGAPGAGGWAGALRQAPSSAGVVSTDRELNRQRVNGVQVRCTLLDLKAFAAWSRGMSPKSDTHFSDEGHVQEKP